MAAAIEFVPMDDVRIETLSPAPRRPEYFLWKNAACDWDGHWIGVETAKALPIEPRGGGCSRRQPVEHDIVQYLIKREDGRRVAAAVGPLGKFLVDPRSLAGRRVCEPVAEGLRSRPLFDRIAIS